MLSFCCFDKIYSGKGNVREERFYSSHSSKSRSIMEVKSASGAETAGLVMWTVKNRWVNDVGIPLCMLLFTINE